MFGVEPGPVPIEAHASTGTLLAISAVKEAIDDVPVRVVLVFGAWPCVFVRHVREAADLVRVRSASGERDEEEYLKTSE